MYGRAREPSRATYHTGPCDTCTCACTCACTCTEDELEQQLSVLVSERGAIAFREPELRAALLQLEDTSLAGGENLIMTRDQKIYMI